MPSMPSIRRAVDSGPVVPHMPMSPAPTSTAVDGPGSGLDGLDGLEDPHAHANSHTLAPTPRPKRRSRAIIDTTLPPVLPCAHTDSAVVRLFGQHSRPASGAAMPERAARRQV